MKKRLSAIVPVLALMLIGSLAFIAAPHPQHTAPPASTLSAATTVVSTQNTRSITNAVVVVASPAVPTATPRAASQPKAQPTHAPSLPAPQLPTPVPTALPTAVPTPAPTWHTLGNFSGSAQQSLGTLTINGPLRITYTCTAGTGLQFSFIAAPGQPDPGAAYSIGTGVCDATHLSGTLTNGATTDTVFTVSVAAADSTGTGAWTALVEVFN